MAVDATGTPSPLGIPKYNTGADAPSGKGLNAIVDALDTLLAARVSKDHVEVAATRIFASKLLAADANPAFRILGDGKHEWGAGGASAVDTNLYRSAANVLKTDDTLLAIVPAVNVAGAAQNVAGTGTDVVLAFNSERYDTDTMHDNAVNNSRLTAKTAGKYLITGTVAIQANGTGYRQVAIRLNGAANIGAHLQGVVSGAATCVMQVVAEYDLAVNDYVELTVNQNSGGILSVLSSANYSPTFAMHYIGT